MSFILEALKKAEEERRQGAPDTAAAVAGGKEPRPSRRRGLFLILILVLLVNAGLLAWWLHPWAERRPGPKAPTAVTAKLDADTPPVAPMPAAAAAPQPAVSAATPSPPAAEPASAPERVKGPAPTGPTATSMTPASPAAASPADQAAPAVNPAPAPIAMPEEKPRPAEPARAAVAKVPAYRELSQAERDRLPEIDLQLHYYTTDAERRLVRINGANLHQGETSGPLSVEEIRPDGVVLRGAGVRFFYPAGRR